MAQGKEMVNHRKAFRAAYLELANVCNGNCPFCPGTTRGPRFMERGLFQRLASETASLAEIAYLHVMGEALLHPEFPDLMRDAADRGLAMGLTTNGTLFAAPNAEALFAGDFRQINVSMHSGLSDGHLEEILAFTAEALRRLPHVRVNYRFWNLGTEASSSAAECLARIGEYFGTVCEIPGTGKPAALHPAEGVSVHFERPFDWPDLHAFPVPGPAFCHGIRRQFAVLADGQVTACCLDRDGAILLGDANREPLRTILSGSRANAMRRAFFRGCVSEELCRRCRYRTRFHREAPETSAVSR